MSVNNIDCFLIFFLQKPKRWKVALEKTAFLTVERKVFWASCLTINIMSREDSFGENEDEDTRFIVPPLPWRSDKDNT